MPATEDPLQCRETEMRLLLVQETRLYLWGAFQTRSMRPIVSTHWISTPNSFRGCLADPNLLSSTITSASERNGGWIKAPEPPAVARILLCSVFFYFWGLC